MSSRELQRLRQILGEAVRSSRMYARDLEQAMGLGNGNLARLLDGSMEIRVRHLLGFARILDIPPGDFLDLGFPEMTQNASHRLADWIGPRQPPHKAKAQAQETPGPKPDDDLKTLIREAVREAIDERLSSLPDKT